jgi:hypothetical protein
LVYDKNMYIPRCVVSLLVVFHQYGD